MSGDPIPAAPGQAAAAGTNFFTGEGNSAIVGDKNLWDDLIVDPDTVYVQEPTPDPVIVIVPVVEPTEPVAPVDNSPTGPTVA